MDIGLDLPRRFLPRPRRWPDRAESTKAHRQIKICGLILGHLDYEMAIYVLLERIDDLEAQLGAARDRG